MSEFIKSQQEKKANLVLQMREALDVAEERGAFDAETKQKVDRIEAEIRSIEEAVDVATRSEQRIAEANLAARGFVPAVETRGDADLVRALAKGEIRSADFEARTLVPSDNTVPKSFYGEVFDVARLVGPMLDGGIAQVINTTSGENLTIPTLTAYSTATIKGAGSAIDASEPTFSSITLSAYKYSFLVPVAAELMSDSGFNLEAELAREFGNAVGYAVNTGLTLGTGSVEPTGVVTAAGSGVTGGTGVAGLFTADDLISLQYTLDGAARRLPGVAYMAAGSSIGAMRKLKDSAGQYLYAVNVGQPDTFAGYNVIENPAMAAAATGAKSVLFGHLPSYKVRVAGGLKIARSEDYAFNQDVTTFRVTLRVDGNLTHAGHIKYFKGAAS